MSTKNLTVLFEPDLAPASPRPVSPVAPKCSTSLSTDEIDILRTVVKDRIRTIYYRRWNLDDPVTDEVIAAVKEEPFVGSHLVALLDRLGDLMSETLAVELMQSHLKKTPRFLAAVRVISKYKIMFPSCVVQNNRDLYLSLKERGYRWDPKTQGWQRRIIG